MAAMMALALAPASFAARLRRRRDSHHKNAARRADAEAVTTASHWRPAQLAPAQNTAPVIQLLKNLDLGRARWNRTQNMPANAGEHPKARTAFTMLPVS
jgi:hypothetical protein